MNKTLNNELVNGITVRPLHPDDTPAIYHLLQNWNVIGNQALIPGTEYLQVSEWLGNHDLGVHRYIAEESHGIAGLLLLTHHMRPRLLHSGSITLAVNSKYQVHQIRQALALTGLDLADNWLNLSRLELSLPDNEYAAIDFFKSIGFEVEGVRVRSTYQNGIWIDQLSMARLRIPAHLRVDPVVPVDTTKGKNVVLSSAQADTIEIRPTEVDDAQAFHEILLDTAICRTTLQLPSQEISKVRDRLKDSKPWLHRFTAVADGEIVGSIAMVQDQSPGHTHIARIGMKVHKDYWGIGIGSRLMQEVTDLADNWLSTARIELDVNTDNPAGIRLYEKFGFTIEGTKRFHSYGDGRWADSFFMARIQEK